MMLMSQVNVFLTLSVYNLFLFNKPLFASFGFLPSKSYGSQGVPILIGFSLASALLTPLETIISFAVNSFSRRLEFAADRFAVNLGYKTQLKSGLISVRCFPSVPGDVRSSLCSSWPRTAQSTTLTRFTLLCITAIQH
jgi:STE24 endopeptidase